MQGRNSANTRSRHLEAAFGIALVATLALLGPARAQPATATPGAAEAATSRTLERVRTSGRLTLGYYADAQPMSYRDSAGNAAGYAVLLCRRIADDLKADLRLAKLDVQWVALTPASGIAQVQQEKVDLLCGADAATLAQRARVSFSLPIFPGGIAGLVRKDASQAFQDALEERPVPYRAIWRASPFSPLQHKTATVVAGTPAVDLLKERVRKRHLVGTLDTVASHEAGVARVLSRDSDVFFGDRPQLLALIKRSPDAHKLRVLDRRFTYEPLALALARNDDDFRLAVDRALLRFYASPTFGETYRAEFGPPDAYTIEYFRNLPR